MRLWPRCMSRNWLLTRTDNGVRRRCERRALHRGWHRSGTAFWSPVRPWVHVRVIDQDGNPVAGTE